MKCQYCNGTGEHINDANRMTTCEFCGGTGVIKPLTNEEWFCGLSTEDKARIFAIIAFNAGYDPVEVVLKRVQKWLKEEHHD